METRKGIVKRIFACVAFVAFCACGLSAIGVGNGMEKKSSKNAAIVLAGCGVYDGSEIHEAVCILLELKKRGATVAFFAPDIPQTDTVNHLTGKSESAPRNVLTESARIARGKIEPLSKFDAAKFDVLIFAGGFGAAKNLSTFAFDCADCVVNPDVARAVGAMLAAKKRLGFLCISPVIAAKLIGGGVRLTVGGDSPTAAAVEKMGARHVVCPPTDFVKDEKFGVWSVPAYMNAADIAEVDEGVSKMVEDILK